MSSHDLENELREMAPPDRILFLLKTRGPQSAGTLAASLGITPEAARQQLLRLDEEGLVASEAEVKGVGRPSQIYRLTPIAQKRFPDTHAELTAQLIGEIREVLGEAALTKLLCARETSTRKRYLTLLANERTVAGRVKRLAEIRSREGYMATWEKQGDDYLLIENHCPICAAASTCLGFCESEKEIFQDVLGKNVRVERIEHVLAGGRRCAYRVSAESSWDREVMAGCEEKSHAKTPRRKV